MLTLVSVFAIACVAVVVWQVGWEMPRQKCESRGDWWDWRTRVCAHPVLLSDITGRTTEEVLAEKAAAEKAKAEAAAGAVQPEATPAP